MPAAIVLPIAVAMPNHMPSTCSNRPRLGRALVVAACCVFKRFGSDALVVQEQAAIIAVPGEITSCCESDGYFNDEAGR